MQSPNVKESHQASYYRRLLDDSIGRAVHDTIGNFVPGPNSVLVMPDPPETRTAAGLHVPDSAQMAKETGTVLRLGPEEAWFKVGDRVIFRSGAGIELRFEDSDRPCKLLMWTGAIDDEILGKFDKPAESSTVE